MTKGSTLDDEDEFQKFLRKYFNSTDEKKIIITFNYDTLIEDNFSSTYLTVGLNPNPFAEIPVVGGAVLGEAIYLLKLHGSIDWFKYSEEDKADIEKIFVCGKTDATYLFIKEHKIPVFVPFSFNKASYMEGNLFGLIWQRFITYLDECSAIEIIGYSFPESDYQVISKIMPYKDKIMKITVKETSDSKKKRLEKLFGTKIAFNDAKTEYPI